MKYKPDNISSAKIISLIQDKDGQDINLVVSAFEFAKKVHEGQNSSSGEPYFLHLFKTAEVLASIGAKPKTIAAGLLHGIFQYTKITKEELEKEFGAEVVFLVEGVTKLGKLKYRGVKRYSESLRKLFVAMSQDMRVIIIKLADRLMDMEILQFAPEHKQKIIAEETLEIFAPIANRLGIGLIKKKLEDLSFPYVEPEEYKKVKELVKLKSRDTQKRLEKIHRMLQKKLAEEKIKVVKTDYRLKGVFSLYKKLLKYDMDIDKIYDISALRIIVPEISDCYKVLGIIHGLWKPLPGRIKDYIAVPKPNGYRSIHTTIFTGDGGVAEIQIRTEEMHREAEYGVISHISYKTGIKTDSPGILWVLRLIPFRKKFDEKDKNQIISPLKTEDIPKWVKELAEFQLSANHEKFIDNLKSDFFKERIFVFTPKGDVIDLPIDSIPIDFAYAIHSDIGNHIFGAKINGKFVSLNTKLQNSDIVEIQTKQGSRPSEKWLQLVKTATAQKQIRLALGKDKIK